MNGRKFHTPLSWSQPEDMLVSGRNFLQEMEKVEKKIRQNFKNV